MNTTIIVICFIITWVIILLLFITTHYNTTERLRSIRHYVANYSDNYSYFEKIKKQYETLTKNIECLNKKIDKYIDKVEINKDYYHKTAQNNENTASLKDSKSK